VRYVQLGTRSVDVLVQSTQGVLERSVDGCIEIFVATGVRAAIHDELRARDREVDPDAVVTAMELVTVGGFDRDMARNHGMAAVQQFVGALSDV
jgi:hypothetical protein